MQSNITEKSKTTALEQRIASLEKQLSQATGQTSKPGQNNPSYDLSSSHPNNYAKQNAGDNYQQQMMMTQAYTMLAAVMTKMYDSMANAYKQVEKTVGALANYQGQGMRPAYAYASPGSAYGKNAGAHGHPGTAQAANYTASPQSKGKA